MALPLCAFLRYASPLLLFCFPIRLSPLLLFCFLNPESLPLMFCPSCSLGFHHCLVLQDLCSHYFTPEVSLPLLQLLAGLGSSVCKNAFHLQVPAVYAQSSLEGIDFYFKTLFGSNKVSWLSFSNKKIRVVKGITLGFHYFSFFSIQYFTVKMLYPLNLHIPMSPLPEQAIPSSLTGICSAQHRSLALLCIAWTTVRGGKGKIQTDFWDQAGIYSISWHPSGNIDGGYLCGFLVALGLEQCIYTLGGYEVCQNLLTWVCWC